MRHEYSVVIGSLPIFRTQDLETAVRHWDRNYVPNMDGAISIKTWDERHYMVRDGNILHVSKGRVYLNPNIEVKH